MKRIFILFIISLVAKSSGAQIAKNTVYLEFLGNGGLYSINFDRILVDAEKFKISSSIGYGSYPNENIEGIPFEVNFLFGHKHYFELGTGISYIKGLTQVEPDHSYGVISSTIYNTYRIGYRYQKDVKGFFFKVAVIPFVRVYEYEEFFKSDPDKAFFLSLGAAVGYSFNLRK